MLIEFHSGHAEIKEFINQDDNIVRVRQYNPPKELRYKQAEVKKLYLIVAQSFYE